MIFFLYYNAEVPKIYIYTYMDICINGLSVVKPMSAVILHAFFCFVPRWTIEKLRKHQSTFSSLLLWAIWKWFLELSFISIAFASQISNFSLTSSLWPPFVMCKNQLFQSIVSHHLQLQRSPEHCFVILFEEENKLLKCKISHCSVLIISSWVNFFGS